MLFPHLKERLAIEGVMPERALLRLRRAGIDVFNVKKTEKNKILLSVKKKDSEKVFAIYPNVCYNRNGYSPYAVKSLGFVGVGKWFAFAKKRVGVVLGVLLFCAATVFADGFVFGVEFVGSSVYAREAYSALEEGGIKPFARYRKGKEDWICAKLLTLDDVEFCSVKKSGYRVRVEMRLASQSERDSQNGKMLAKHTGKIVAMTVLRGTALKQIGEDIRAGEALVGDWFSTETGEQVRVQLIARVRIACAYEETLQADSAEAAFAAAYLALNLQDGATITEKSVREKAEEKGSFHVKIIYTVTESMNL